MIDNMAVILQKEVQFHDLSNILAIEANPAIKHALPLRYKMLAVSAYDQGEISEEQLSKYLRTDRVQARFIVDEIGHQLVAEKEGEFGDMQLDLSEAFIGR